MHLSGPGTRDADTTKLKEIARACACANLRKAARAVTQVFDEALDSSGLRVTQFTLLVTSRLAGETPVTELAERMVMDRTTLSRNLKPLVRKGLLEVRPGEDGRMRLLRITPEGERMLGRAYPLWEQAQHEVVSALGEDRYEALLGDVAQAISLVAEGSHDAPGGPAKGKPQT